MYCAGDGPVSRKIVRLTKSTDSTWGMLRIEKKPALGEAGKQYWKQCEQCRTEQVGYKLSHSVLIKIIVINTECNPNIYAPLSTKLKGDGHHKLHFPDDVLFFLTANKPLTLRHK